MSNGSSPTEYVVRCGTMRVLSVMTATKPFAYGDDVVVQSERGTEVAEVLCEATPVAMASIEETNGGRILRAVTKDDQVQMDHLTMLADKDVQTCQQHVDRLGLIMSLIEVERLLGGERIVVYFVAEQRVDFRQLVRDLAREFQTRIEMRQIGVRDEAKLLADYGDCGRPVCCANHLIKMPPVSMRMAKVQKATLDPNKISGRCGRLKCCLRYEFETYEELVSQLPTVGSEILTREGNAKVLGQDILSQQLMIQTEDRRRILIPADEVVSVIRLAPDPDDQKSRRH
ncbi:MAG: regulatory iron-sulfur-containing complex subunit RicT [Planctomycetota bacterium]